MSMAAIFAVCSTMASCEKTNSKIVSTSEIKETLSHSLLAENENTELPYRTETMAVPSDMKIVNSISCSGDMIYMIGSDESGKKIIVQSDKNLSSYTTISEKEYSSTDILLMSEGNDSGLNICVVSVDYGELPEPNYNDPEIDWSAYQDAAVYSFKIDMYGKDGKLISSNDVSGLDETIIKGENFISDFVSHSDGEFAMVTDNQIIKLDSEGKVINDVTIPFEYLESCGLNSDGQLVCSLTEQQKTYICTYDLSKLSIIGDASEIKNNDYIRDIISGSGDYSCYLNVSEGLYGIKDGKLEKVLDWVNTGLSTSDTIYPLALENGEFVTAIYSSEGILEIVKLVQRSEDELQNTEIIKLAAPGGAYPIEQSIKEFNRDFDGQYRIEVNEDYGSTSKEDTGAVFGRALIAGENPDVLYINSYSDMQNLAGKGAFADLYTFMQNDPELSKDMFLSNIMEMNEYNGKLSMLPYEFNVNTIAVKTKYACDAGENWNATEMLNAIDNMSENMVLAMRINSAEQFMWDMMFHTVSTYIDYEKRTCNFNSPEFVAMLKTAQNCPKAEMVDDSELTVEEMEEYFIRNDNAYKNDEALFYSARIGSEKDFEDIKKEVFGGDDITLVGYPSSDGNGANVSFGTDNYAIIESGSNKDGAWTFLRRFYLDKYQNSCEGFSVLNKNLDLKDDKLEKYIKSVNKIGAYDYDIFDICMEEAQFYFAGEHSAEQTAELIQNRISILVSEQS